MSYDHKIQQTKTDLKTALIQLMQEKTFPDITIELIVQQAQLTRGTFYRYYHDKYALIDEIEDDLINLFSQYHDNVVKYEQHLSVANLIPMFQIIEKNSLIIHTLLGNNTQYSSFIHKLKQKQDQFIEQNTTLQYPNAEKQRIVHNLVFGLTIQILTIITQPDRQLSLLSLAEIFTNVIKNGFLQTLILLQNE
ncbi:TetR/AcrR family transcriptional regulator [Bombilactobacillus thymidiniphilus]|uniref:TetR/AcrR family transcriptional regulator n=1 Tax=Bombilactobacillus thymidiniphilus TaxID=2923363 RepID=A0ABY4PDC7_9LACO|nr:TetR/AcrR family transcriptional regulator [Bombilactobacillus thymidiniphilus]UQS83678.1 TetR/AcrR family transcriptional regulator [Bombilactobacillus thymidiniphilus]